MHHELANMAGYLGSTFGVVMVVPQVARIARHPRLPGVSAISWSVTAIACLSWLIYGIRTNSPPQIPGNILLVTGATLVVLMVPVSLARSRRALSLGGVAAVVVAASCALPAHMVGYLAFSIGLFSSLPQVAESIANYRTRTTSGVSMTTWLLRMASQFCWLAYAFGVLDLPVMISACVNIAGASTLIALEYAARTARPAAYPAPAG